MCDFENDWSDVMDKKNKERHAMELQAWIEARQWERKTSEVLVGYSSGPHPSLRKKAGSVTND